MRKKTGLVLEGGAMRGMYTAGVLDIFMENGIELDGAVGVSAGTLFGVNYLSGQIGRVIRYNKRFAKNPKYMGVRNMLVDGNIIGTDFAYNRVPIELDPFDNEAYKQSDIPFYATLTNVDTGEAEYLQVTDVIEQMDVLRAGGSMPIVSKPVEINGKRYLDGGISDSIPFDFLPGLGYDRQVFVLTQDISYEKYPFPAIAARVLFARYPKVAERMIHRFEDYNNATKRIMELEKEGKAFVIRPSEPVIMKTLETSHERLDHFYELGRADALNALPALRQFLKD